MDTNTAPYTPPPGWVTHRQAAEMMGVSTESITQNQWKYRPMLKGTRKCINVYNRGTISLYPVEVIEKIKAAQAADAAPEPIPEGFVDKDGACEFFGIERHTWKKWINDGRVPCGQIVPSRFGGKRTLYALEDLHRLKAELFDESRVFKKNDQTWNVPADYLSRDEACQKFGVSLMVWWRWERQGKITCGQRVPGGPKLYKPEDIHHLLDEYGKWCPPYPDPNLPDVYRVPLNGHDIKVREALVDADIVPLIEGSSLSFTLHDDGSGCVLVNSDKVRSLPLRRLILGITDSNLNVRHTNRNPLDCRRANLVVRTIEQRCRNMRKAHLIKGQSPSSRFKGVYWEARTKKWRAAIHVSGKKRTLGRHTDQVAAAQAYDEAAKLWFGQDAWLNFPHGLDAWLEAEGYTQPKSTIPRAA